MKKVKPYQAARHFNMVALKLRSEEKSGIETLWTGQGRFLSGVGMGVALAVESLKP